jgi:DNA-3-methyladenine glycosylase
MKLPREFYLREDVTVVARELIGKVIYTKIDGVLTGGLITETEAYAGIGDRASHAFGNRRTNRTGVMYGNGGHAYVYLCYGIHALFNVVSNRPGIPHAILVRGIFPVTGVETVLQRAGKPKNDYRYFNGPGKVTRALAISVADTGTDLSGDRIWVEDNGITIPASKIESGRRIGIDYAGEDAALPYRFHLGDRTETICYEMVGKKFDGVDSENPFHKNKKPRR